MEAVKHVAMALNEIFEKEPLIMKRQVKTGQEAGSRVEGIIDLEHLPTPKIVMINCSFDSVCLYTHTHTHIIHIHTRTHTYLSIHPSIYVVGYIYVDTYTHKYASPSPSPAPSQGMAALVYGRTIIFIINGKPISYPNLNLACETT